MHRCAAILQRVRPDILLLNEFDHEGEGVDERALTLFLQRYLGLSWPRRGTVRKTAFRRQ